MSEAYTGLDLLGMFLSGGASNLLPSASLGGLISSKLIRGMSPIYTVPVQGLIVEDATPENGEGTASISISGNNATYTPPGGSAGSAVAIAAGQRKLLTGVDDTKAVRIFRESGKTFSGIATFELVDMLNGVVGMSDVPDADRQAGSVTYRALFLKALGNTEDILAWITTDGQAAWALATEEPESDDTIQTISDEDTAPGGVAWVEAVSEGTAIDIGNLLEDEIIGLWIRRTFPAVGTVATEEQVNFHLQFGGG